MGWRAAENGRPGQLHIFSLDEMPDPSASHLTAAHDTSLLTALVLGRQMGADLPHTITIIGITTHPTFDFSEALSPAVAAAVPAAVTAVLDLISPTY